MSLFASMNIMEPFLTALRTPYGAGNDTAFPCRPVLAQTAEGTIVLARFCGHMSLDNLDEFSAALHNLVTEPLQKAILDLAHATMDRTGLGALVGFASSMHGRNKRLYLYKPSYQVVEELRQTGLEAWFVFLQTEEEVLSKLIV